MKDKHIELYFLVLLILYHEILNSSTLTCNKVDEQKGLFHQSPLIFQSSCLSCSFMAVNEKEN